MNTDINLDYIKKYAEFLKNHLQATRPIHIVFDASNGATGPILQELIKNLPNVQATLINETPDPEFPAHGPNPLEQGALEMLGKKVIEIGADLGAAFDADGDRAFFVDNKGRMLPSYIASLLLFRATPPPYVADEIVYMSLKQSGMFKNDADLIPSKVGTIYVKDNMKKYNATTSVEFSGHYYFKNFFNNDAGIFSTITIINELSKENRPLADIVDSFPTQIVKNENIKIKEGSWLDIQKKLEAAYASNPDIKLERREGITLDKRTSWINIRPSNTEPLLRLIAGVATEQGCDELIQEIKTVISEYLV